MHRARKSLASVLGFAALLLACGGAQAEPLKIATVKSTAPGALFIAEAKGYFAAEKIEPQFVYFDSPGPVTLAVVSGSADIASTGVSAQLYTLAAHGAVKIFAGQAHEAKGYQINAFILSNAAAASGLKRVAQLGGHSVAISLIGSPVHYAASQVALKHGVKLANLRFLALQSNSNILSAVIGGTADTGVIPATVAEPALAKKELQILTWVGDEAPWQSSAVAASLRTLDQHTDLMRRFMVALKQGLRDYHDAFSGPDGARRDGTTAPAILAILAKYLDQPPERLKLAIPYVDPEARLDFADMRRQLQWFEANNMLKEPVKLDQVIDRRFAKAQPGRE